MKPDFQALEQALLWHLGCHLQFTDADAVKLLFQAVSGMDHLLADRTAFRRALEAEWARSGHPLSHERLLEPVHPGRKILRLNLRPAKAAGIPKGELIWFLSGQSLIGGSRKELARTAWWSVEAARRGRIPLPASRLKELWDAALGHGHPPGHSPAYRRAASPAYRLVHSARDPEFSRLMTKAQL
ncbi:MAG: hypothetical protein R6U88_06715 [Candidatus Bipolaricaulota bacterium]